MADAAGIADAKPKEAFTLAVPQNVDADALSLSDALDVDNAYAVNLTMDGKTEVLCTVPGSVLGMAAQPTAAQASADGQAVTKDSASAPAFSAPSFLKWLLIPLGLIVLFVLWFVLTCMYRARKVRRQRARIAQMRRQSHRRDEESR